MDAQPTPSGRPADRPARLVLVLAHTARTEARAAAQETLTGLAAAGVAPVLTAEDRDSLQGSPDVEVPSTVRVLGRDARVEDVELAVVLGGDGSILRAAEIVRDADIPLLGVNLGHVGFLAEFERSDLLAAVQAVVDGRYTVEERLALDVSVWNDGRRVLHTWALNEASVEKGDREKMLEVVTEIDSRPISSFGCDGVVLATPTGSTAYAFSAGGPVVWPEVEALLMVPLSPHALFSRPLVVAPSAKLAVEVLTRTDARGVLWCDGRRTVELPPGSRIEVSRSGQPVLLARMHTAAFSERLVRKFGLPIVGWRGPVADDPDAEPATTTLPILAPRRQPLDSPEPGLPVGREIPQEPPAGRGTDHRGGAGDREESR